MRNLFSVSNQSASTGRLILVRHGESEGNRTRTFTDSPAVSLTDLGREQARRAGTRIASDYRPARVVASPYARARQTAEIIAGLLQLPLEIDPVWREQSLGRLAGQSYDRVLDDPSFDPDQPWAWRPPDGESLIDVCQRVAPAFDRLAQATIGADVVMVSHAGVMRALCAHVAGNWPGAPVSPNGGIILIEHDSGRYSAPILIEG